jgi:hypothetical protein
MEVSLSNWKNLFVEKDTSFFSSGQMNFDGLVAFADAVDSGTGADEGERAEVKGDMA